MGTDWLRFQLRPEADLDRMRTFARLSASLIQQTTEIWLYDPLPNLDGFEGSSLRTEGSGLEQLASLRAEIDPFIRLETAEFDGEHVAVSMRIIGLSSAFVFPPSVRLQMYRTILPCELVEQVTCWRQWMERVRSGDVDDYLRRLFLHYSSIHLHNFRREMQNCERRSRPRANTWTKRAEFQELANTIRLLAPIDIEWSPTSMDPPQTHLPEGRIDRQNEMVGLYRQLKRRWNRTARPELVEQTGPTFDEFLASGDHFWEALPWLEDTIDRRAGLLLDF